MREIKIEPIKNGYLIYYSETCETEYFETVDDTMKRLKELLHEMTK